MLQIFESMSGLWIYSQYVLFSNHKDAKHTRFMCAGYHQIPYRNLMVFFIDERYYHGPQYGLQWLGKPCWEFRTHSVEIAVDRGVVLIESREIVGGMRGSRTARRLVIR